jgi:HAD superfamily hydrolase (TIGR01509 family)
MAAQQFVTEVAMQALFFDCDGVLADTERDGHRIAFNAAFRESGLSLEWSVERYGELLATSGGKERLRRHFDETDSWPVAAGRRDAFIRDLHACKTRLFIGLIESGALPLRPGVAALVDEAIAANIGLAVCSTSDRKSVQAIVDTLLGPDRAPHLPVFAGDIVAAKKPDPAIYEFAARSLGVAASRCLVVEDSRIGLQAARAAAMRCIVTRSAYTGAEDMTGADLVLPSLAGFTLADCASVMAASGARTRARRLTPPPHARAGTSGSRGSG